MDVDAQKVPPRFGQVIQTAARLPQQSLSPLCAYRIIRLDDAQADKGGAR